MLIKNAHSAVALMHAFGGLRRSPDTVPILRDTARFLRLYGPIDVVLDFRLASSPLAFFLYAIRVFLEVTLGLSYRTSDPILLRSIVELLLRADWSHVELAMLAKGVRSTVVPLMPQTHWDTDEVAGLLIPLFDDHARLVQRLQATLYGVSLAQLAIDGNAEATLCSETQWSTTELTDLDLSMCD